jgi:ribosomal protein S18 acetylase RimI-like enzyme
MVIRLFDPAGDVDRLRRLDTSFVTRAIYDVTRQTRGFSLTEKSIEPPLRKDYMVAWRELETASAAIVAECNERLVGLAAIKYATWNRRAVISHLYVDAAARGEGVGFLLVQDLVRRAKVFGARSLFVETQNVNFSAIQFYERCGFALVGLDVSLYDATDITHECALFFAAHLESDHDETP